MEALPFPGGEIEPVNVDRADALGPYLAVDVMAQADEIKLDALIVPFRSQRVIFGLAGLRIDGAVPISIPPPSSSPLRRSAI